MHWLEWEGAAVTAVVNMGLILAILTVMVGAVVVLGVLAWKVAWRIIRKRQARSRRW